MAEPERAPKGKGWPCKIYISREFDLYLSVSSLMELRNGMGQAQVEMKYHPQTLELLDYLISAAQDAARRGDT